MMEPPSLVELRDRIEREGRQGLFAVPLGEVRRSLPEPEVGNILSYVGEHLGLRTLGDFLDSAEARKTLEGALRPENRRWVLRTLEQWVSRGDTTPRRFVPASLPAVADPGRTPDEIEAFARTHGVSAALDAPARRLRFFLGGDADTARGIADPTATVGDYLHRQRLPDGISRRSTAAHRLADAARALVHHEARVRALETERARRWDERPDDPRLRMLSARLRESRRALAGDPALEEPLLDEAVAVVLEDDPPGLSARFRPPRGTTRAEVATELDLSGFEHRAPSVRCTCGAGDAARGDARACPHRLALVSFALDAVHDPAHTLHEGLARLVAVPTWARFLDEALSTRSQDETERTENVERLVFRLERTGDGPIVRPAIQRRAKSGAFSVGSATSAERVATRDELIEPSDRVIVDALVGLESPRGGRASARGRSAREAIALRALVGHPRVFAADAPERAIRVERGRLVVALAPVEGGLRLELRLHDHVVSPEDLVESAVVVRHDLEADRSFVAEVPPKARPLVRAAARYPSVLPEAALDRLLAFLPGLQPEVELAIPPGLRGERVEPDRAIVVRLEPVEPEGLSIALRVRPVPGGPSWPAGDGPELAMGLVEGRRAYALRDREDELARAERMRARLVLHDVHSEGPFTYRLDDLDEALGTLEILRDLGDEARVEWPEGSRAYALARAAGSADLRVRVRRAESWFAVEGGAEIDGLRVPLTTLLDAARRNKRFVEIAPGTFARIERELVARLSTMSDVLFRSEGALAIGAAAAPSLRDMLGAGEVEGDAAFDRLRERIDRASAFDPAPPATLRAELRPYQADGIRWLLRLASWGAGAVLADEMGLGKTVQALGLLLARAEVGPALVVAPTSVASNWIDEARRFAPDLEVRAYHGQGREAQLEGLSAGVLLVTSYDVLARDADALAEIEFGTLVLDEAQAVKNARTRRARAAQRIDAPARVALTGTPLENHLGELHSLFHIVSPGLLGTPEHFRTRFAQPIERDGDLDRKRRLSELLRPFLLRRTKSEVALDLPPRTEVTRVVELSDAERRIYDAARAAALDSLTRRTGPENERRFAVLAALTRLRLLACHPRLADPTSQVPSSKLETFLELVQDLRAEGHRALVFSQFTSHLKLVQERLDGLGIPSLYLDGQTPVPTRRERVQRFQEGDDPLFLISLRAGGTGLNLTAADYVVHLDPWWNPAVEDQASDRAHRIGQSRPVTVVRLVAQGTIEETVMELHAQKRELLDDLLEGGDAAGKASAEELLALLRASIEPESLVA